MKVWVLLVSLLVTNLMIHEGMAAASNTSNVVKPFPTVPATPVATPTPFPTVSSGGVKPRNTGDFAVATPLPTSTPLPTRTPRVVGDMHPVDPLPPSGVCCFSKVVIGPSYSTASAARKAGGSVNVNPQVECESKNGTWYANKTACPAPTPAPTSTVQAPTGFCCYPKGGAVSVNDSLNAARNVNPQLVCQQNGGTWKTSGSCQDVVHPTDPLPPSENGLCCNKAPAQGGGSYNDAAPVPSANTARVMGPKDRCLMDPTKEWLINVTMCPRYANPPVPENGICCSPLRRPVPGIVNSVNCQGENTWKPNTTTCGRIVGDAVPVPIGSVRPSVPVQTENKVDPGANEPLPCPNFKPFDGSFTIGMCMDGKGKFASYRGQQGCCLP